jgi:PAS domain-containing protein
MAKYKIENKKTVSDLIKLGKAYIILTFIISSTAFTLWFLNFNFLKKISIDPNVLISPISAFAFMLLCISIWLIRNEDAHSKSKLISTLLCIIAGVIGLTRVLYFSLNIPSSLDALILGSETLFPKKNIQWNTNLNLMSPITGVIILHTSISIWLVNYTKKDFFKIAQFLNFFSVLIGLLAIYTYVYDIESLYAHAEFIPISMLSSICTVLISTGMLFLRPHKGSMVTIIGQNSTQIVLLRFLAFFIPLIIGSFKVEGMKREWFGKEFGTAISASATFAISMTLLGWKSFIQAKLKKIHYQKEEHIRKNEQLVKHILDVSPLSINIVDLESNKFVYVNQASKDEFRINGESLKNVKYSSIIKKLVVDEDKDKVLNRFEEIKKFKKGDSNEATYRLKDKNGEINWIKSNASVFEYKNDRVQSVILNSLNITKQKKLEEKLKEKNSQIEKKNKELKKINQRLEEINKNLEQEVDKIIQELKESKRASKDFFKNSFEGILHYGFEGIEGVDTNLDIDEQIELITKHVIITKANKELVNMHGYDHKDELIGTSITDFIKMPQEDKLKIIKKFVENDYRLEKSPTTHTLKNGNSINLYTTITGIIEDDKLIGAWATQILKK